MRRFLLNFFTPILFLIGGLTFAQTAGFNSTFVVLSSNGGPNTYYDLQAATGNPDFDGANLGSFNASNSLTLKGAEHNVYKCGGCDLTSTRLYYRIYATGTSPGAFSNLNIGYASGFGNGCGGEDQQWANTSYVTNLLSGLSAGNYTVEVYSDAAVTCEGGTIFAGNLGANYKANFTFCGSPTGALTPGNYSIPGCFPTVASAVTYLNSNGVSGTGIVQFDVASGHVETAPTTGILLNGVGTAGNLATGNASLSIVFKKSGSGANPRIVAPLWAAGGNTNGIIKIIGGDYITFDGFTLEENSGNTVFTTGTTNTMTEIGFGLFLGSNVNGAQNNTIKNCTITLNGSYPNSIGIFSTSSSSANNTTLTAASTAGTNSFNTIQSNTISSVAYGIYFICQPITATVTESGNVFGGASASLGNTITFGNSITSTASWTRFSSTVAAGIVYRNGANFTAQHNIITSLPIAYSAGSSGIYVSSGNAPVGVIYTATISDNTITITNNGVTGLSGIDFGHGLATSTHIANNNTILLQTASSVTNSSGLQGIRCPYSSSENTVNGNSITINQIGVGPYTAPHYFINVGGLKGNLTVQSNMLQTGVNPMTTTSNIFGIYMEGAKTGNVIIGGSASQGNIMNIVCGGGNTVQVYGTYGTSGTSNPTSMAITHNSVTVSGLSGATIVSGIYNHEGNINTVKNVSNNTVQISGTHTGSTRGLFLSTGIFTVNDNILNLSSNAASNFGMDFTINGIVNQATIDGNLITLTSSADGAILRGISASLTDVINGFTVTNNTIESITSTSPIGNATIFGIKIGIGANNIISGNTIKNLTAASSSGESIISGVDVAGTCTNPSIFGNKIYNIESLASGFNSTLTGISSVNGFGPFFTGTTITIYNNFISDIKAPQSNSINAVNGIMCFAAGSTFNIYYNTIKLGTSTPLSGGSSFGVRGIFVFENTSSTIYDLRNNIININATPSGNGYASCVSVFDGVANSVPLGFASTSNNNIYHINSGANNYLFAQGADALSVVNGFAVSGLTNNVTNNILNDPSFNASCGYYKTFMGGTLDALTYTEDNLSNGVSIGTYVPSGTSFAENGAQGIASPSITVDFDGNSRAVTNDIGALQFSGTTQTYSNPTYSASVMITSSPAGPVAQGTPITFTATPTNGGSVPTYQWFLNSNPVLGETNSTFTISTLNDLDEVTVEMVSNDNCAINPNATSNVIVYDIIYQYDTSIIPTQCGSTLNSLNQNIFAVYIASAQAYRFKVTDLLTNQVQIIDRPLRVFQLTQFLSYAYNRTYQIEVAARVNNVWQPYGIACNVSTPIPLTNLSNCAQTLSFMDQPVYANIVPFVAGYRFKITNTVDSSVQILDRPLREFRMSEIVSPQFNTLYQVEIAVRNTDGNYLSYGSVCNVLTPPIPTSKIITAQCGSSVSLNASVFADNYGGATMYRFKIENTVLGFSYVLDRPLRAFEFSQVPGVILGQTYEVSVSVQVGGVFGPYGAICNLAFSGATKTIDTSKPALTFNAIVSPNPFGESFGLEVTVSTEEIIQVKIYDMLGKLVESRKVDATTISELQIGANYPSGVYNVIVSQGEEVKTLRVIKR
jgi:Secretion system C-terminal sorting domain